mmetsp:Transcript_81869/g.162583  ORF Transcript_81869/g.162583 Transcript_81869/m.162583 type:complete len:266 (+) Transcript_81869:48-845(+)
MQRRCPLLLGLGRAFAPNQRNENTVGNGGGGQEEDGEMPPYHVRVNGYEVGRRTRHVIYSLTVSRGNAHWPIRRRFRQVAALHMQLMQGLGRSAMRNGLPRLPPRVTCLSLWRGRLDDRFLRARSRRLQSYFEALLQHIPYVDQCEALHEFLCSVDVSLMSYDALLDLGQAIGRGGDGPPVVEPAAIAALPRRNFDVDDCAFPSSMCRCVICQEPFLSDEDVRILPCGHEYHFDCIAKWIPHSNTCCVCQGMAVLPSTLRPADKP